MKLVFLSIKNQGGGHGDAPVLCWLAFGEATSPPTRENAGVLNLVHEVVPMS